MAVLATIFGLATSLGFGAQQVAGGLHYLFDVDNNISTQVLIILFVTLIAIISVARGMHGGVKLLSNINIFAAMALFSFVFIFGPSWVVIRVLGY